MRFGRTPFGRRKAKHQADFVLGILDAAEVDPASFESFPFDPKKGSRGPGSSAFGHGQCDKIADGDLGRRRGGEGCGHRNVGSGLGKGSGATRGKRLLQISGGVEPYSEGTSGLG